MQNPGTDVNNTDHKNNCVICGAGLVYFDAPRMMECAVCHQEYEAEEACGKGHFICDGCHLKEGARKILDVCKDTKTCNPISLAQSLMNEPCIHMHGPEHHILVGAVLLTCYANSGGNLDIIKALDEMVRRGKQVPGGVCGFWGCCGAAISTGIAVSIITGADPLKNQAWKLSNLMTSRALEAIGDIGGPRCCKRDSFTAIREAVSFVKEYFDIHMELPEEIICSFSSLNQQCIRIRCPYHRK